MIILTLVLIMVLIFLLYYGYCLVQNVPPFWYKSPENSGKVLETSSNVFADVLKVPPPDKSALGYCTFTSEDLQNKTVFDFTGKLVPPNVSPVKCSDCNNYIFKNSSKCTTFEFDKYQNLNIDDSSLLGNMCDSAHPERRGNCVQPHGVCTVGLKAAQTCPF